MEVHTAFKSMNLENVHHPTHYLPPSSSTFFSWGSFNYYVDKMRGGGGQKMSVFVHAQGIKPIHAGGGGQKMVKFDPRSR